jgi:hypothetical protein
VHTVELERESRRAAEEAAHCTEALHGYARENVLVVVVSLGVGWLAFRVSRGCDYRVSGSGAVDGCNAQRIPPTSKRLPSP